LSFFVVNSSSLQEALREKQTLITFMNKDQKLLEEAYQSIYESSEQELLKHMKREGID
jgi:hypothetical protein